MNSLLPVRSTRKRTLSRRPALWEAVLVEIIVASFLIWALVY